MKKTKIVLFAMGAFFGFTASAALDEASVAEGKLHVYVKVARSCYVQDASLNFGTIDGLFIGDKEASTDIIIRCTADAPYQLGLDDGKNFVEGLRHMVDGEGNNLIGYTLYQPDNTTLWDKDNLVSAIATGSDQAFTVHGVIPNGQVAVPGDRNYEDHVIIDLYMASSLN